MNIMSPKVKICGEISLTQYFHCTLTYITLYFYIVNEQIYSPITHKY